MLTVEIGYISCDWDPKNAQDDPNLIYREEYCEGIIVINLEVKYLYDINAVEQGILVVGSNDQQYISTVDTSDSDICEEIYNNFFYDFELNDIKLFSHGGLEIILRLFKKNTYGNSDEIESLTDADCEKLFSQAF